MSIIEEAKKLKGIAESLNNSEIDTIATNIISIEARRGEFSGNAKKPARIKKKYAKMLKRRMDHLESRRGGDYDKAEASAIKYALSLIINDLK